MSLTITGLKDIPEIRSEGCVIAHAKSWVNRLLEVDGNPLPRTHFYPFKYIGKGNENNFQYCQNEFEVVAQFKDHKFFEGLEVGSEVWISFCSDGTAFIGLSIE